MDTMPEDNSVVPTPPPLTPEPETTPELPLAKPKTSSPILPMLFGVIVVLIISSVLAGTYYFAQLKKEVAEANPSPSPAEIIVPSLSPSASASATATPSGSVKPSAPVAATPKPTVKPTPTPTPTKTPSSSPTTTTSSLDIRFGNPSAHVKQTLDEGTGDGRVINREYSSIQVGEFDEIRASWNPKVTACFHVVSNQELEGSKVGYTVTENDKVLVEGTMSQYSKIEVGKIYDVCHDTTTSIGTHKLQLNINNTKSLSESTYANNTARVDFKNNPDNIAPNFTLAGPYNWNENGTCFLINSPSDNVTPNLNLKVEHKIDNNDWTTQPQAEYCFKGTSGVAHNYRVRMTDARGNKNEQSSSFNLY